MIYLIISVIPEIRSSVVPAKLLPSRFLIHCLIWRRVLTFATFKLKKRSFDHFHCHANNIIFQQKTRKALRLHAYDAADIGYLFERFVIIAIASFFCYNNNLFLFF